MVLRDTISNPAQARYVRRGREGRRTAVSSKPRRLAVIAVATSLAAGAADAGAARAETARAVSSSAQVIAVSEVAAVKPPASVMGLARDLGVDTGFAWRTLDELARSGRVAARSAGS
jgi:hypothetical protein